MPAETTREALYQYGVLRESISSLALLIQVNPNLTEEVIALALLLGAEAGRNAQVREEKFALVKADMDRGITEFWKAQS